jgi:TPR repeat protein
MTLIIDNQSDIKTYNFDLYVFEMGSIVAAKPGIKRMVVREADLNSHTMDLFERAIVYVSPQQKTLMPQAFMTIPGMVEYLDACSAVVPVECLPQDITDLERLNHNYYPSLFMIFLKKSARKKFPYAVGVLATCYYFAIGIPRDVKKSLSLYNFAADNGIISAQYHLACEYYNGKVVQRDLARAFSLFEKTAEAGSFLAQAFLAGEYKTGQFIQKDLSKAFALYHKSANQGLRSAQFELGRMYYLGEYVEQDLGKAFEYFQEAAKQDHLWAQSKLAIMYLRGESVPKDSVLAFEWFQKSANAGFDEAQVFLGDLYYHGQDNLAPNVSEARVWYQKAVIQGRADAYYKMGLTFEDEQDFVSAFNWYEQAAKKGYAPAQMSVAHCYRYGRGVTKDLTKAVFWYQKAAEKGNISAQDHLEEAQKELDQSKQASQTKLQVSLKIKFDALMKPIKEQMFSYEMLQSKWPKIMGVALEIESFRRIKDIQESVDNGDMITGPLLNELKGLSDSFPAAVKHAEKALKKAEKERKRVERQAEKAEKRASRRLELASIPVEPVFAEPESITRSVKAQQAAAEDAKEKRKSVTLERRLSRSLSRNSLKLGFDQTQEQLAREKERHEERKSQRLSRLYTKEELIAAGILPADNVVVPVKTYGRIASFEKGTQEIFEGKREAREYTELVRDLLQSFADSADLNLFKKVHKFEKLKKGLGNLVGVDHLKPWERNGCRICSFRVSDAIPERIVFAWNKKEQKAYQVTFVNYHPK